MPVEKLGSAADSGAAASGTRFKRGVTAQFNQACPTRYQVIGLSMNNSTWFCRGPVHPSNDDVFECQIVLITYLRGDDESRGIALRGSGFGSDTIMR
jgi:hypothetical protein